ncbi:MAG: hypothetical protein BWY27_00684 [Bacteroidetes bacterium ADurb.Bin234]|nr:MAG: hypothetical protein BWY27_00684 [Bacteroidetes bacterium ADurb.Bin234]
MKNLFIIFLIITTKLTSFSQSNLVPNSSFELGSECANIEVGNKIYDWLLPEKQSFNLNPFSWGTSTPVGTSDWFCPSNLSHSGNAHIRALVETQYGDPKYVEYATAKLLEPLVVNKIYFYRYFVRADAYEGDKVGLGFTIDRPVQKWKWKVIKEGLRVINNSIFKPDDGWVEIKGIFIADQAYKWITIGCYAEDFIAFKASQSYRYDDIRLWEYCPPQMLIENHSYEFKESAYEAINIRAGYDVDAPSPNGSVIIGSNADIIYKAETEVSLEPGFETQPGAEFLAFIAPCGRNCDYLPSLNFSDTLTICSQQKIPIGLPSLPANVNFVWTAEPASAMQYLINANSTNPVFDTPPNSCGHVVYTLKVWNECDEVAMKSVHIKYNTSNLQSSLQIQNLQQNNFYTSFNVLVGQCADKLIIQIFSSANNYSTPVYTQDIDVVNSNNAIFFSTTGISLSPCYNYRIKLNVKTICDLNEIVEYIDWVRSSSIQLIDYNNVITANNDGQNDCLEFSVSGADFYHVQVFNSGGLCIYNETGVINNQFFCTWKPQPNQVSSGVYFWTARFWNSCNQESLHNGFVQLLHDNNKRLKDAISSKGINLNENELFFIFPNPVKDELTILFAFEGDADIILIDLSGREILKTKRNNNSNIVLQLNGIAAGAYYIVIKTKSNLSTQKVMIYE